MRSGRMQLGRRKVGNLKATPIACAALTFLIVQGGDAADDQHALQLFETRIRPALVKHCYECHSTESEEVKGNLLVDSAAGLLKGGDSGPALVRGKPEGSLLLEALRYESFEMPPAGRLPDEVIQDFERWVKMGAPDPRDGEVVHAAARVMDIEEGRRFWAFQPPQTHTTPAVHDASWPRSDIDAFILARLEAAGLKPAHDAEPRTLARRLYYDLIGLPPTPAQTQSLEEAASRDYQQAVTQLVDELLESPQFGVHWGRHWLDVARYADSNGGDFNATFHNAWRYRNYVVDAMNRDKPFDQFVREQIAGDLLPFDSDQQRAEQIIATGFLMIGTKMLSERDKDKLRLDVVDEQVNTVGQAFLGMTLGCARCHDHKFDPIPTQDYYALAGIFNSTRTLEGESQEYVSTWKRVDLPAATDHVAQVQAHQKRTEQLTAAFEQAKRRHEQAEARLKKLAAGERAITIDDVDAEIAGDWKASTFSPHYVGKGYIHDNQTDKGEKSVEFKLQPPTTASYEIRLSYTHGSSRAKRVPITIRHAEGVSEVFVDQTQKPPIDNLFASLGRFHLNAASAASVVVSTTGTRGHVIVDAVQFVELDDQGRPIVASPSADDEQVAQARADVEEQQAELTRLDQHLKDLQSSAPPPLPQALAASDLPNIADCRICIRGEHRNLGPIVQRGFLQVAATDFDTQVSGDQSGRLELADWIASPHNPLTARVIVNRIWQHVIGEGIVRSPDNFGLLGERPTHPELLDRLALDFVHDGWSIKRAIRRIVLSRAYQMSSQHDERSWRTDAENRLLWRAHRRSLPAESIRDSLLAISGRLDLEPSGSPVEGLGTLVTTNNADTEEYERKDSAKRSLYLPIIRNELPPLLTVFDFADPDLVTGKRPTTNVPAQALLLLNSPFVIDCARQTAKTLLAEGDRSDEQLVEDLYWKILGRAPTGDETASSLAFLRDGKVGVDESSADRLGRLAHVLFASTEFRFLN